MAPEVSAPVDGKYHDSPPAVRPVHIPGLPEGLIALRYGKIEKPDVERILGNGWVTKGLTRFSEGLIVKIAPGYKEHYVPSDDRCFISKEEPVTKIRAEINITDPRQTDGVRRSLEDMGFTVLE